MSKRFNRWNLQWARTVALLGWICATSCHRDTPSTAQAGTGGCQPDRFSGFASPNDAYVRYAHAIDERAWCDAIGTFARGARPAVSIANFKGLVSMAGARGAKQAAYQQHLQTFCRKRALDCASDARAATVILDQANGEDLESALPALEQTANKTAELMYIDLMTELTAVDPTLLSPFEVPLADVVVTGDHASGTARQRDGSHRKLSFVKNPGGWMLSFD